MDTPLPSTEIPKGDWIGSADPHERHQIQNRPASWSDSMEDRVQPIEPDLNSTGLVVPAPIPGSLQNYSISQNPQFPQYLVQPATRNPILDLSLSQEKSSGPIQGRSAPVGSLVSANSLEHYPSSRVLGTETGMNNDPRREMAAPVPTIQKPSLHEPGPKIWTGTHFLPRFMRAAEVPGEGLCYFYDDGSHCKTVVDGEVVNAHWGVTKAGKPRKRLAIACVTCREKKIKCDPDYPRCIQCEKFGRVCKFKNAPRSRDHVTSPSTPLMVEREVSTPRQGRMPFELPRPSRQSNFDSLPMMRRHSQVNLKSTAGGVALHIINEYPKRMEKQGEWGSTPTEHPSSPGTSSMQLTAHGYHAHEAPQAVYAQAQGRSIEMREELGPTLSPIEKDSSVMESPGDSLDSDMLSISSGDSDHVPPLDPEDPLTLIINVISHRILNEYKESRGFSSKPQSEHTENGGPRDNSGNSPVCATSQSRGMNVRYTGKRVRPDGEDDERDEGGSRRPPRPTKRPTLSPPRSKLLACPFWKLDSQAHRLCFQRKCSRISDVKYHLARKHKLPATEYCQRCWTAFTSQSHKEEHLRDPLSQGCQYNQAARPVGIDNSMAVALHKKSDSSLSTEDQWFAIWDITFPDRPRPSSPYIDNSLSEDATQLRETILNQWPSILSSVTEEAKRSSASVNTDRLDQEHLIGATLARLLDEFSAEQETMRAAELASNHQSPGGRTVASSNRADSAIELESYPLRSQSSSNSGIETSMLTTGAAARQLEAYRPTLNHSSMYGGRERPILPAGQDIINIGDDPQEIRRPPPPTTNTEQHIRPASATGRMVPVPDLINTRTTDNSRADHVFEPELTMHGSSLSLTTDDLSQAFSENGEFNGNISWAGLENSTAFNWSMFDMEADNNQSQTENPGGE